MYVAETASREWNDSFIGIAVRLVVASDED